MCHPLMNGVQQPVRSAPSVFLVKKKSLRSDMRLLLNQAQKDHPQRISWLLVAFFEHKLGAIGWLKKKKVFLDKQF